MDNNLKAEFLAEIDAVLKKYSDLITHGKGEETPCHKVKNELQIKERLLAK